MPSLRSALAAVALLLLASSLPVAAQGPANARTVTLDAPALDVDLAHSAKRPAVGLQDTGSRLTVPPTPDKETWFLYTADGKQVLQAGGADPASCDQAFTLDDCDSDVTHVAVARQGDRMVVGSVVDADTAVLVFVSETAGPLDTEELLGNVVDLAISDDGAVVVAATSVPTSAGGGGRIYLYNWTSSKWTNPATLTTAPTKIALAPDGAAFTVAAGGSHLRFQRAGPGTRVADATFPGTVRDVGIANAHRHTSVAASTEGWFVVYNDATGADRREFRARDSTSPLVAAAIRADATAFAVANEANDLLVYSLDASGPVLGPLLGRMKLDSVARDLRFSNDGQHLLAVTSLGAAQYGINATGVHTLWTQTQSGLVADGAISGDGEVAALASGTSLLLLDALHKGRFVTPAAPPIEPGTVSNITVRFENAGNRLETATLSAVAPAGWNATLSRTRAGLAPGQGVDVVVRVTAPAGVAPGTVSVALRHDLGRGAGPVSTPLNLTVPEVKRLVADPVGNSIGISAGATKAVEVNVRNTGNVPATPQVTANIVPSEWKAALSPAPTIQPGQAGKVKVDVTAPAGADEGDAARLLLSIDGQTTEVRITVGARFDFELSVAGTAIAKPGDTGQAVLTITNTGNAADGYTLQAGQVPVGFAARFPGGSASHQLAILDPGRSATVVLSIDVPANAETGGPPLAVIVGAASKAEPTKTATKTVLLSVAENDTLTPNPTKSGGGGKGIPSPAWPALLAVAAVAVALRRRRD